MSLGVWFWIGMFIWLIGGFVLGFRAGPNGPNWGWVGGNVLLFILLLLLGVKGFGWPVHG